MANRRNSDEENPYVNNSTGAKLAEEQDMAQGTEGRHIYDQWEIAYG